MLMQQRWLTVLALSLLSSVAVAQTSSSSSFVLSQSTLGSSGAAASSASFLFDGTSGQPATVGRVTSGSFVLESGFWNSSGVNYTLFVDASGGGAGQLAGAGIDCAATAGNVAGDCSETVGHGTRLNVVATPAGVDYFTGWSGCDSLSTTSLTDDTCAVVVSREVTASASFTAPGNVGDLVWLDYDGNGVRDAIEPGISDAVVNLSSAVSGNLSTMTDADGSYGFINLFPGSYTIAVDPNSLPAGTVPSFDADGVATPDVAVVTVNEGLATLGADFGYQPFADLAVTLDSINLDNTHVLYTIMVENLGQADAVGIVAEIELPPTVQLLSSNGCLEDPLGAPACSLGDLAAGERAEYTLEVQAEGAGSMMLMTTVMVSAIVSDPDVSNNSASVGAFVVFPVPALNLLGSALLLLMMLAMGAWHFRREHAI